MGQQLHQKNNNNKQKIKHLYLNLKVHHLSWYNIDLVYSSSLKEKGSLPQQIDVKLVMTNYISTPNIENSKKHMVMTQTFDDTYQNFMSLFTSFEKRIKSFLMLERNIKELRKNNKKKSHYRASSSSKEEYKAKMKELEKNHSQVKREIKLLLLELFRD